MSKNAVEVRDIHKRFSYSSHKNNSLKRAITQIFKKKDRSKDEFYALDGISFDVEKGDFFGILGRNGSGKSTLLKIISEIYQPTSGTVKHDGKLVSFIELGVGFKKELTGKENVYLNAALLGFSKIEVDEMYDDIVEFAELEKFMDQSLKNYSSGMKVRLAFSVAIRAKADILILDEVLAVGDAAFKKKCNEYFKTLKDDKKTVILVTHSMTNVREFCNKAIIIEDGKILFEGDAEEVADTYLDLFGKNDNIKKSDMTERIKINRLDTTVDKDNIISTVELQAIDDVDNVKLDILIKNSVGKIMTGTNTMQADGGKKLNFKTGEIKKVKFISPNILSRSKYSIVATAVTLDGEILDRKIGRSEIANPVVDVPYPTIMPAKTIITEK